MADLFADQATPEPVVFLGGDVLLFPGAIQHTRATETLERLSRDTPWRQESINVYGKTCSLPRLTAWHGEPGTQYTYSAIDNDPLPWTETLLELKRLAESLADAPFNSVLLNHYRDGRDSIAWHSDDEKELGEKPVIASISLGQERVFKLRHKQTREVVNIPLTHGSLLVMCGATQRDWQHSVPKSARRLAGRINLTFRHIRPSS